jgi:hypothetical protein
VGALGCPQNPCPHPETLTEDELNAWRTSLTTRQEALRREKAELMASLDQMDPRMGARAARALADRMDELEQENLSFLEEIRRVKN